MRESLDQSVMHHLQAVMDSNSAAILYWINSLEREALSWTRQDTIGLLTEQLAEAAFRSPDSRQALLEHPAQEQLASFFAPVLEEEKYLNFIIVDRGGRVLACNDVQRVGLHVSSKALLQIGLIFEKGLHFSKPSFISPWTNSSESSQERPLLMIGAVINKSVRLHQAALVFLLDPHEDFSHILSLASFGKTGNMYAFDREGRMLSTSRFEAEYVRLGLIQPQQSSVLNLVLRDPGRRLRAGVSLDSSLPEQPFTRSVSAAVAQREGIDITGYRDCRGVVVYGAWRWLERYDFGVAVEVGSRESRRVLRPMHIATLILFIALIVLSVSLFVFLLVTAHMRTQIHRFRRLGQYEILEKMGEGGVGVVYRATHAMLRRETAVKLLKPDKSEPDELVRFEREVRLSARLTHPNTIEIYDYGRTRDGLFYYAMEYLRGMNLAQLIEMEGELPPARAIFLLRQICGSLHEAHFTGLVHRDIKPMNIYICQRGLMADFVKVLDFGLVKEIVRDDDVQDTKANVLIGTPEYISPERIKDPSLRNPRSDLYSLGALAFNMLTAQQTYQGSSHEIIQHVLASPIPRPSERSKQRIPTALDDLVVALLAKEASARPESAQSVVDLLDAIETEDRWGHREAWDWAKKHQDLFGVGEGDDFSAPQSATAEFEFADQ